MKEVDFRDPNRKLDIEYLKLMAVRIREDTIVALGESGSGHTGGSLSCTDILVSLYFVKMRHDPKNPKWPDRDRLLLSKGHAAPALYSTLAEAGYFPREELKTLRKINSRLQGHPDPKKVPGVEIPGGPEGIGLSEGIGMALAARLDGKQIRVYVVTGDGELDEGEVWEAAMAAAKFKLDNLVAIVDKNGLQQEGRTSDIMPTDSIPNKFKAFNWNVVEINGNDIPAVLEALDQAEGVKGTPTVIVASTLKGKGVDFMENKVEYHAKTLSPEVVREALKQIQGSG
jgi:transketolase